MTDKKKKQQQDNVAQLLGATDEEQAMAQNVLNAGPDEGSFEQGRWGGKVIYSKVTRPEIGTIKAKFREEDVLAIESHTLDETTYYVRFTGGHYVIVSEQAYALAEAALTTTEEPF